MLVYCYKDDLCGAFDWILNFFLEDLSLCLWSLQRTGPSFMWQTPLSLDVAPEQTQSSCCLIQYALWSVSQTILVWKNPTFSHIFKTFTRRGNSMLNLSMRYKWALVEDVHTTNGVLKLPKWHPFLIFCNGLVNTPHMDHTYLKNIHVHDVF